MQKNKFPKNGGLIKMVILIIIILILLAYFGFNLRTIVSSQTFVDNWSFLKSIILGIWSYISGPISYIWNTWFIPYVWEPIMNNASK